METITPRPFEAEVLPKNTQLPKMRYCLYARKSSEPEERQAMSISSQVKEMKAIAERDQIFISGIRTESCSAKASGEREVFNKVLEEVRSGKFNAILTWNADRLSRNAGDLGRLVDLMDQHALVEIKTFGQTFSNSPNEKFLLMILGSQAKLENDNKSQNVRRGLRALAERGLYSGTAPLGYKNSVRTDQKGLLTIDPIRGHMIKEIFEKAASGMPHRHICKWLREDVEFLSPRGNKVSLSTVQYILKRTLYYGEFEFPRGSGKWYKGIHQPLITKELFDAVQQMAQTRKHIKRIKKRNFAFTRLMRCGLCGSGVTAQEKFKLLKDGSISKYIYYGCTRTRDNFCRSCFIREDDLIDQLREIVDKLSIDDLGIRELMTAEVERMFRFYRDVMGYPDNQNPEANRDMDTKKYFKYLLAEGSIEEKRQILFHLKNQILLKNKHIFLDIVQDDPTNEFLNTTP